MKVILLKDVPKVGQRYDIKDLADGYAQNVLIAKGLAIMASPKELAKITEMKAQAKKKQENEDQAFIQMIEKIKGIKINIKAKANEKGHLFKSITNKDIADAVSTSIEFDVTGDHIMMEHIKELGTHAVKIKKGKIEGEFEITIDKE